jgi:peptidyl-prolyl cis-trans isomerase B (cyclophilin B)
VTTDKRRRQLAREKYERQQAKRAEQSQRHRRRQQVVAAVVIAALVVGAGAWIVIGRQQGAGEPAAAPSGAPSSIASAAASALASAAEAAQAAAPDCRPPGTPRADDRSYDAPPAATALATAPAVITLTTNCGPIAITTLPDKAPLTVASEVFLAQEGFYDNTACHRVTTDGIYVLQCGDPKGDGTGGPGYSVPDENLPAADGVNYPAGTVAMANAGPGTAGSQFFIVYRDTTLPPGYTIWGTVTEGLDLVQGIAAAGVEGGATDGRPAQPVFIESAAVSPA